MPPNERTILANIIRRCWDEPAYREEVFANPTEAFRNAGIQLGAGETVEAHETSFARRKFVLPPHPVPAQVIADSDLVPLYCHTVTGGQAAGKGKRKPRKGPAGAGGKRRGGKGGKKKGTKKAAARRKR